MERELSRRTLLAATGASSLLAVAGCVGGADDSGVGDTAGSDGTDEGRTTDADATWLSTTLEDTTTGEQFTIGEFDRPVLVHTFATWCSVCRGQQIEFSKLRDDVGGDVEIVDLTIGSNADPGSIRDHAESESYGWRFVVSPQAVTESLIDEFGREVSSAPQSPVILRCPDGRTKAMDKQVSSRDLSAELERFC